MYPDTSWRHHHQVVDFKKNFVTSRFWFPHTLLKLLPKLLLCIVLKVILKETLFCFVLFFFNMSHVNQFGAHSNFFLSFSFSLYFFFFSMDFSLLTFFIYNKHNTHGKIMALLGVCKSFFIFPSVIFGSRCPPLFSCVKLYPSLPSILTELVTHK